LQRKKIKNEELGRLSADEYKKTSKNPLVVVLDNVRSLNNVGSAFRTCDAFLVEKLCLAGITGKPPHRDINKTALGATDSVKWEHFEDVAELVKSLKKEGYYTIAIEQVKSGKMLNEFNQEADQKYALIFGNEVFGVTDQVIELVDECIEIPQFGTKHSLNISVSIGIVLWEFLRKISG